MYPLLSFCFLFLFASPNGRRIWALRVFPLLPVIWLRTFPPSTLLSVNVYQFCNVCSFTTTTVSCYIASDTPYLSRCDFVPCVSSVPKVSRSPTMHYMCYRFLTVSFATSSMSETWRSIRFVSSVLSSTYLRYPWIDGAIHACAVHVRRPYF